MGRVQIGASVLVTCFHATGKLQAAAAIILDVRQLHKYLWRHSSRGQLSVVRLKSGFAVEPWGKVMVS